MLITFIRFRSRRLHGRRGLKCKWQFFDSLRQQRRRLHGRRGLKYQNIIDNINAKRRRLHGRRGLKSGYAHRSPKARTSPPSRAAWIEIDTVVSAAAILYGRRLHGRRGLKFDSAVIAVTRFGRRLHGRRGLKSTRSVLQSCAVQSPPSRAAWIEITCSAPNRTGKRRRRLHGRRGLKYQSRLTCGMPLLVAAFTGGVD